MLEVPRKWSPDRVKVLSLSLLVEGRVTFSNKFEGEKNRARYLLEIHSLTCVLKKSERRKNRERESVEVQKPKWSAGRNSPTMLEKVI